MIPLEQLERRLGGRWTGVRFCRGDEPPGRLIEEDMSLCQMIALGLEELCVLPIGQITCFGAVYALGAQREIDPSKGCCGCGDADSLAGLVAAAANQPRLDPGVTAVAVGPQDDPDVVVSYCTADVAQRLVEQWQRVHGEEPHVAMSTFMAICGNAIVGAYLGGTVCASFGCPLARKQDIIGPSTLVIGMPANLVAGLVAEM